MLCVKNLSCTKGDRTLFSRLDFSVPAGTWLHVRGENGAGKTSLLRLLAGLGAAADGVIEWQGQPVDGVRDDFVRELLYLGHQPALKEDLTPFENLTHAAELDARPVGAQDLLRALRRMGLQGREDLPVRVLSAGQKRRVMLTRLLTRRASLWVLDEPFTALDARACALVAELLQAHLQAGGAAVLTSHQDIAVPEGRSLVL